MDGRAKHERDADAGLLAGNRFQAGRLNRQSLTEETEEGGGKNWEMIGGQEQDLEFASPRLEYVNLYSRYARFEVCDVLPWTVQELLLPGSMITCSMRNEVRH
jgi:hypothetical protein